jgi:hypothetical protein
MVGQEGGMMSFRTWTVLASIVVTALVLVPSSLSASDAGTATAGDPVGRALGYVGENPAELGVTSADVANLFVTSAYRSAHSGVTHVNLNQRFRGLASSAATRPSTSQPTDA